MTYIPVTWKPKEKITSARLNHIEQGIAILYPQEMTIASEQEVVITSDTQPMIGEPLTITEGVDLSSLNLETALINATINGKTALLHPGFGWVADLSDRIAVIQKITDPGTGETTGLTLTVVDDPATVPPNVIPGNYTVKVVNTVNEGPFTKNFPVYEGFGSEAWIIDAPHQEVDAVAQEGCALLYPKTPSNENGFVFGTISGIIIYYVTVNNGVIQQNVKRGSINEDGKYVINTL